jgi:hypothetical protein
MDNSSEYFVFLNPTPTLPLALTYLYTYLLGLVADYELSRINYLLDKYSLFPWRFLSLNSKKPHSHILYEEYKNILYTCSTILYRLRRMEWNCLELYSL